jgi:hypothetical protein
VRFSRSPAPLGGGQQDIEAIAHEGIELGFEAVDGVAGEIEAQGLLFALEAFLLFPFAPHLAGELGVRDPLAVPSTRPKEVHLTGRVAGLVLFRQPDCQRQMLHQGGAVGAEFVQSAGADQGLQDPPVHLLQVDATAEVPEVAEAPPRLASLLEREDGALPYPLDGAQAIDKGAVVGDGELPLGGIHRGWSHLQAHGPALVDEGDHLVGVVHVGAEDGGHEGSGIMGLEPEGLIGNQGIGGGV